MPKHSGVHGQHKYEEEKKKPKRQQSWLGRAVVDLRDVGANVIKIHCIKLKEKWKIKIKEMGLDLNLFHNIDDLLKLFKLFQINF